MIELTYEQKNFLRDHKVPLNKVFNATGMSAKAYGDVMKRLGMWVAYGVTPCRNAGHQLRLRSGHCFQCAPAGISYLKRHDLNGEIYVAYSLARKIVKVGSAVDSKERIKNLNIYGYGGANDWVRFFAVHSEKAGMLETSAQAALAEYATAGCYVKTGQGIECRELFSCSIPVAVEAVKNTIKHHRLLVALIQDYKP